MRLRANKALLTSPYLLSHADNPVDWWTWDDDAFAQARRRDVPVLLSVGYAACHWCHVMARESFADPETAAQLNDQFVAIKVDREERPDVDSVYMHATQALTGSGGWPMTAFLDHDGRVFLAGTYFPKRPGPGRPSFRQVLEAVSEAWRTDRQRVLAAAGDVAAALSRMDAGPGATPGGEAPLADATISAAVDQILGQVDATLGGFGGAPKFPPALVLEFLLRADPFLRGIGQPDPRITEAVASTLGHMARGGMYDQLGGGFARYSVDVGWVVPHFEKMLYDNAQLLRVYLHWWRATGDPLAARVTRDTAGFLLRELAVESGGFASALDADSPDATGVSREGAFYVWTPDQLDAALGPQDGAWVARLCGVSQRGTFEAGTSVVQLRVDPPDQARWDRARERLLAVRDQRVRPARDDKVVTGWNGLAIAALAEAGILLAEPAWIEAAEEAARYLLANHLDQETGTLWRCSLAGRVSPAPGVLEDYALLAEGLLALYQVTGRTGWLDAAEGLMARVLRAFPAGDGSFFDTASDSPALVRRPRDLSDGVTPSGNSATASALLTLGSIRDRSDYLDAAAAVLAELAPMLRAAPRFAGWAGATTVAWLSGPVQVAISVPPGAPATAARELTLAALGSTAPGLILAVGPESSVGLLAERPSVGGVPTAYPCRGQVCDLPVTDAAALRATLDRWTGAQAG